MRSVVFILFRDKRIILITNIGGIFVQTLEAFRKIELSSFHFLFSIMKFILSGMTTLGLMTLRFDDILIMKFIFSGVTTLGLVALRPDDIEVLMVRLNFLILNFYFISCFIRLYCKCPECKNCRRFFINLFVFSHMHFGDSMIGVDFFEKHWRNRKC